jgi:hypothetical protein
VSFRDHGQTSIHLRQLRLYLNLRQGAVERRAVDLILPVSAVADQIFVLCHMSSSRKLSSNRSARRCVDLSRVRASYHAVGKIVPGQARTSQKSAGQEQFLNLSGISRFLSHFDTTLLLGGGWPLEPGRATRSLRVSDPAILQEHNLFWHSSWVKSIQPAQPGRKFAIYV